MSRRGACDFRFMHPCLHTCSVRCHVEFSCCATRTNREVHSETLLHQAKQSDPETDGNEGTNGRSGLERLLQNMRAHRNVALASERWHEASEIQHAIVAALDVQPHQKD